MLLHQESNERLLLDAETDWQNSKLKVMEQAGGAQPRTEALMHRNLAGTPMAHSFLPCPEMHFGGGMEGGELCSQPARRSPP